MPGIATSFPGGCLCPKGVSGAIRSTQAFSRFRELSRKGIMPLGAQSKRVLPSALKAIIHVTGINLLWRFLGMVVRESVRNAMALAKMKKYKSMRFPLSALGQAETRVQRCRNG